MTRWAMTGNSRLFAPKHTNQSNKGSKGILLIQLLIESILQSIQVAQMTNRQTPRDNIGHHGRKEIWKQAPELGAIPYR